MPSRIDAVQAELMQRTREALLEWSSGRTRSDADIGRRGISFSPAMIEALRAGRKTQTRRRAGAEARSRLGQAGDVLYVRERVALVGSRKRVVYLSDDPTGAAVFRPAIFMPKSAARMSIRIDAIRIERLRRITRADALAEGCPPDRASDPIGWYRQLWDQLNPRPGQRWADNPRVWVVQFSVIAPLRKTDAPRH